MKHRSEKSWTVSLVTIIPVEDQNTTLEAESKIINYISPYFELNSKYILPLECFSKCFFPWLYTAVFWPSTGWPLIVQSTYPFSSIGPAVDTSLKSSLNLQRCTVYCLQLNWVYWIQLTAGNILIYILYFSVRLGSTYYWFFSFNSMSCNFLVYCNYNHNILNFPTLS